MECCAVRKLLTYQESKRDLSVIHPVAYLLYHLSCFGSVNMMCYNCSKANGARIFQNFRNDLKILGASNKFHAEDPQISGDVVKTLVWATRRPEFVHPWDCMLQLVSNIWLNVSSVLKSYLVTQSIKILNVLVQMLIALLRCHIGNSGTFRW